MENFTEKRSKSVARKSENLEIGPFSKLTFCYVVILAFMFSLTALGRFVCQLCFVMVETKLWLYLYIVKLQLAF